MKPAFFVSIRASVCGALALLGCATAFGAAVGAADTAATSDEVVTVPEFQVNTTRERDAWFASNAMSGTRTAAPIIELPYQVQVLTQEFLEDFQLISLSEQMSFFTGYSGAADQADAAIGATSTGRFLRGFPQTIVRDGFRRTPPPTLGNTAQVEVIKGPISTLYGDASPGGLINYVTKRPTLRPTYSLTLSAGSYDFFRSNVNASGPLYKDKVFYLFTADNSYRKSSLRYVYARQGDYLGTLLFKPFERTSLSVSYEIVRLHGARGASIPFFVTGTRRSGTNPLGWTGGIVQGIDWRLARMGYSRYGPNEAYDRNYDGLSLLLEHAYNSNWKHRIAYQGQWKSFDQGYRTSSNVSAETGRMNNAAPNRRLQDIDGPVSLQTDLLGHFATGSAQHALLFTADYAEEETYDAQMRLPTAQEALLPDFYRYPDPFNQDWTPVVTNYDTQLTRRASKTREKVYSRGGSVSDRVSIDGGRIILMGNVRYDRARFAEDENASVDRYTYGEAHSWTYSVGANVKLRGDALVAFANHSTSFDTNPTIDRNTGTTIPNEKGRGVEAGFKSLLPGGRVGLTISGYRIEKTNIGQANPDFVLGNGEPEFLGSGTERVLGVDGDATVKVSDALTFIAGASYIDPRVMASSDPALRNTRKVTVPRTTAALSGRYKFSGSLKGLSVGAAFRFTGDFVRANATATRAFEMGAPRQIYSGFVSYAWRGARFLHSVRLNGTNLADKLYVAPDNQLGLGRQINFTYTLSFK